MLIQVTLANKTKQWRSSSEQRTPKISLVDCDRLNNTAKNIRKRDNNIVVVDTITWQYQLRGCTYSLEIFHFKDAPMKWTCRNWRTDVAILTPRMKMFIWKITFYRYIQIMKYICLTFIEFLNLNLDHKKQTSFSSNLFIVCASKVYCYANRMMSVSI